MLYDLYSRRALVPGNKIIECFKSRKNGTGPQAAELINLLFVLGSVEAIKAMAFDNSYAGFFKPLNPDESVEALPCRVAIRSQPVEGLKHLTLPAVSSRIWV